MIQLSIKLFGAFRQYVPKGEIDVEIDLPIEVAALKKAIAQEINKTNQVFSDMALIEESALASEEEVFTETDKVTKKENLSLLPPVCGG